MPPLPLVPQLQQDALDPTVKVSDLLRKAKFVAAKLNLPDLMEWADKELLGYKDEVPQYRIISGTARAFNPYQGWKPIIFETSETQKAYSTQAVGSSAAQLEELMERDKENTLAMSWPPETEAKMRQAMGFQLDVKLFIDRSMVSGILDAIRNSVLDWSLKLEAAGIMGEGFTFTQREKELAHQPSINYQIGSIHNFSGNLGPASDSATINSQQSIAIDPGQLTKLIDQIEKALPAAELSQGSEDEARELVAGVRAELSQTPPDQSKLNGLFGSLKRIVEGAASKVVADGITSNIDSFFPS
ncbi:AbiTii domain-containing protein [Azospirillum sp. sgz301742]